MTDDIGQERKEEGEIEIKEFGYESPDDLEKYLPQYFAVREKAFSDGLYRNGPTDHDIDPSNLDGTKHRGTRYVLAIKDDTVIGGSNYFPITPDTILDTPIEGGKVLVKHILKKEHMISAGINNPENMKYVEVAGLAIDPDPKYKGKGIGMNLQDELFKRATGAANFLVGSVRSTNFIGILNTSKRTGLYPMVFEKQFMIAAPSEDLCVPMAFSKDPKLPGFLEEAGITVPADKFIYRVKAVIENDRKRFFTSPGKENYPTQQIEVMRELFEPLMRDRETARRSSDQSPNQPPNQPER